jgi:hypothetical protein
LTFATPSSPRPGELLPWLVPAHRDDALGAELLGGQHAEQADRTIAHHGNRLARTRVRGDGAEPAGAEYVGQGQEARDEIVARHVSGRHQGPVGEWHAHQLGLGALRADADPLHAGALIARPADLAGVVGSEEGADHELAGFDRGDLRADLRDEADVLVTHRGWAVHLVEAPVRPQVRAADAGRGQPDDRVRRLQDLWIGTLLHPNVTRGVHHDTTHGSLLRSCLDSYPHPQRPRRGPGNAPG